MLTDLHLHKYLEGHLSEAECKEVEAMLAKNPEMQAKLEALKGQSQVLKPIWQRVLVDRKNRKGSRTRYTTLLPALLMLMVVLMVTRHWFSRPGENSTFTMSGGNGSSLELLYNSPLGWRYLDKDFKPTDSISIAVRDSGIYYVTVFAIYGRGVEAKAISVLSDDGTKSYSTTSPKPIFVLKPFGSDELSNSPSSEIIAPDQIMVVYKNAPLRSPTSAEILDIIASRGIERGGIDFKYQIFSAGH